MRETTDFVGISQTKGEGMWCKYTSIILLNEGDIGMANYEEQVEQEAAYPIHISLYSCYRTVRHEKRGIAI